MKDEARYDELSIATAVEFTKPGQHWWSGWPGAWCFHCGTEDAMEIALADNEIEFDDEGNFTVPPYIEQGPCEPVRYHNYNPYMTEPERVEVNKRLNKTLG